MAWLPDPEELLILPVEQVAMHLLKRLATHPNNTFRATKFTSQNGEILTQGPGYHAPQVIKAIQEAFDWLYVNGLTMVSPNDINHGMFVLTRRGLQIAEEADPLRLLRAENLLTMPLHPAIRDRARLFFGAGEYEAAVLMAFRELEIRLRAVGPYDASDLGPPLMRNAFNADTPGPLTDPALLRAERLAVSDLYAGAMGAFKNPLSHRTVDYADPTIAAEQILLADLLHRMLDGFVEARAEREGRR